MVTLIRMAMTPTQKAQYRNLKLESRRANLELRAACSARRPAAGYTKKMEEASDLLFDVAIAALERVENFRDALAAASRL